MDKMLPAKVDCDVYQANFLVSWKRCHKKLYVEGCFMPFYLFFAEDGNETGLRGMNGI